MPDDYTTGTDDSGGRYMLFHAPAWDGASSEGDVHPGAYLQLGSYPKWGDAAQRGDDLLEKIGLTSGQTKFFADDYRHALGKTAGNTTYTRDSGYTTATSTPIALTTELMTRGGWRLHSDGNYVSTTRGDRVDVIGGNYHLAVLGRTDGASDDTVWRPAVEESSGGHRIRDDVARRGRITAIEWDSTRGAYKTYINTLKGHHTLRHEGPYEEVFECDTIKTSIGPAIDGESVSITATDAEPHQQSDPGANWINPSSGAGSNWPRTKTGVSEPAADVVVSTSTGNTAHTESIAAESIDEVIKVTQSHGTTTSGSLGLGSYHRERHLDGNYYSFHHATGIVEDFITADAGATVKDEYGFKGALLSSTADDDNALPASRYQLCLGEWRTLIYEKRNIKRPVDTGALHIHTQAIVAHVDVGIGVRSRVTDLVNCVHPNWIVDGKDYWQNDYWDGSFGWVTPLMETLFWGQSELMLKLAVPTLEMFYGVTRSTIALVYNKMKYSFDHVELDCGSADKVKMFKVAWDLLSTSASAVKDDTGVVNLSAHTTKVKS